MERFSVSIFHFRCPFVAETSIVSFRTLSFCFPLIAFSKSSRNSTLIPAILDDFSLFDPLISGHQLGSHEVNLSSLKNPEMQ